MKLQNGQVSVVTGAASGIGFGLAEALGARGLTVVLADVEASALEAARASLAEPRLRQCTRISATSPMPRPWTSSREPSSRATARSTS